MVRQKNMKRRRIILSNTFDLIKIYGMDRVSFRMIADRSGISKSLMQSYYPYKSKLTNTIVRNIFNTLAKEVNNYDQAACHNLYARINAFIYTIVALGMQDCELDRIIGSVFVSDDALSNWGQMLNSWIKADHLFDQLVIKQKEVELGIAFVTTGIGRLYREREKYNLTAVELADYATTALMFSFLHCSGDEIDQSLKNGHQIIKSANIKSFYHKINTMFDGKKEFFS